MLEDLHFNHSLLDLDGTVRTETANSSLEGLSGIFEKVGITRVANVTGLDQVGVPVWMVVRPLARSLAVSQGKGITHALAQVSGIMECVEIYHAEHFVPSGRQSTLLEAARNDSFVHPLLLPIRLDTSATHDTSTRWVEGKDILSGRSRWIPRQLIDLDFTANMDDEKIFQCSSNGLCSGNTKDEAILHGLCEVIERDQISFWLVSKTIIKNSPNTRIIIETIDDKNCRWLINLIQAAGLRIVVWYASTTLNIPCFVCTVYDDNYSTFYPQRASGYGCHPYRRIALSRAITEALQSRLTHISGVRDDTYWSHYRDELPTNLPENKKWISNLEAETQSVNYLKIPEAPTFETTGEMFDWIVKELHIMGFDEVLVFDLTNDEIGIPVLYVIAPGQETSARKSLYSPGIRMQSFLEEQGNQ